MKNFFTIFFAAIFFNFFCSAQNENSFSQVMVPRDVFIGDTGQVQVSFRSPVDFFSGAKNSAVKDETLLLDLPAEILLENPSDCLVKKTEIIRSGTNYNLCITIVPWKTGEIKFREFDLMEICSGKKSAENEFKISLAPVTILSLTEKLGITKLKNPRPPELLPYTIFFVWLSAILFVACFAFFCVTISRLPKIIRSAKNLRTKFDLYMNLRRTKKKLALLLRKKCSDDVFAECWQKILRGYLGFRFGSSFQAIPAKKISEKIFSITEFSADEISEASEKLERLFVRTDYIRFARGSIDSDLSPSSFNAGEKKSVVADTNEILEIFEK